MREQSTKNKVAWEYRAYEFWNSGPDLLLKTFYVGLMVRLIMRTAANLAL